jgi:hypothetical protein
MEHAQAPVFCTLTGVDEGVDLDALADITFRFPNVEWGFLYSPRRAGQDTRYPDPFWIEHAVSTLSKKTASIRMALHVCGQGVDDLAGDTGQAARLADRFANTPGIRARVQLNLNARQNPERAHAVINLVRRMRAASDMLTITQHNADNAGLSASLMFLPGHAILIDGSGGRGERPETWPAANALLASVAGIRPNLLQIGYAGGLGPETIRHELPRIAEAAIIGMASGLPYWIDMESSLRDSEDRFDLTRAETVLATVAAFRTA